MCMGHHEIKTPMYKKFILEKCVYGMLENGLM